MRMLKTLLAVGLAGSWLAYPLASAAAVAIAPLNMMITAPRMNG